MEYYTTPHPHSNLLGQQLYEVLLHYRELLQIMNLNTKIFNLETLHYSFNKMYSFLLKYGCTFMDIMDTLDTGTP